MSRSNQTPQQVVHKAIKKAAGLSDWDDLPIAEEVEAIFNALDKNGFVVVERETIRKALPTSGRVAF